MFHAETVWYARYRLAVALLLVVGIVFGYHTTEAQGLGGLTVTPTRIVFEKRDRSAEVTLINTTSSPATYRISFKNMRMLDDGSYEDIEVPMQGELFAGDMIRYAPRQVTLEPGMSQTVRLLLRRPANLPAGEYRSHLLFQSLPPETAGEDIENTDPDAGNIQIQIRTVFAVTIPVIVHQGEVAASVTLTDPELDFSKDGDETPILSVRLNRTGTKSVYGELNATFIPGDGGNEYVVGMVRGLGVLYPYQIRRMNIPLNVPDGVKLESGRLEIVYRAPSEEGGDVLAQTELMIP